MAVQSTTRADAEVLVVEDDEELRDIIADILEECGWEVIPASNGKQALDYLAAADALPRIILLDLMMPLVSGWECLRTIKASDRFSSIPVVVMTAVGRDRPAGVDTVLNKPFPVADLLHAVSCFAKRGAIELPAASQDR